jgi:hypothetical protein
MNKSISDEKIIVALLNTDSKTAAAKALGIRTDTLFARMQSESFLIKYQKAKDNLIAESVTNLQKTMNQAVSVVSEIMMNPGIAPQIRINAADTILRYAVKLTETEELIRRIEELENMTEGNE